MNDNLSKIVAVMIIIIAVIGVLLGAEIGSSNGEKNGRVQAIEYLNTMEVIDNEKLDMEMDELLWRIKNVN